MIVVQENIANSSHATKLGLFVKRCGLRIFVWGRQRNSTSIKICTLIPIPMVIRWLPLRTWKCVARRGTPSTQSPRLTSIGFGSILRRVVALDSMAIRAQRNLGRLCSKRRDIVHHHSVIGRCNAPQDKDIGIGKESYTNGVAHGHKMEEHLDGYQ